MKKLLASTALAVALFAGAQSAKAGLQVGLYTDIPLTANSGNVFLVPGSFFTPGAPGVVNWNVVDFGNFTTSGNVQTAPFVHPPGILNTNDINTAVNGAGTLSVFVDASGLTAMANGDLSWWTAGFTFNGSGIGDGASVTIAQYLDINNDDLATFLDNQNGPGVISLGSATHNGGVTPALGGPFVNGTTLVDGQSYSVITEYIITADASGGTFNDTTALSATVPEPAPLALLGFGLAALAFVSRRRSFQN